MIRSAIRSRITASRTVFETSSLLLMAGVIWRHFESPATLHTLGACGVGRLVGFFELRQKPLEGCITAVWRLGSHGVRCSHHPLQMNSSCCATCLNAKFRSFESFSTSRRFILLVYMLRWPETREIVCNGRVHRSFQREDKPARAFFIFLLELRSNLTNRDLCDHRVRGWLEKRGSVTSVASESTHSSPEANSQVSTYLRPDFPSPNFLYVSGDLHP